MNDPWLEAQRYFALGRWDEARRALGQVPPAHPRFPEVEPLVHAIDDAEIYDQVPGLSAMPAYLASSRSRRNWPEFKQRRTEAENLLAAAAAKAGRAIQTPYSLTEIFEDGIRGEDAQHMLEQAVTYRKKGEFAQAATLLADAETLDPRYPQVHQRDLTADLAQMTDDLRRQPLNTAQELLEAQALCDELCAPDATPNNDWLMTTCARISGLIDERLASARAYSAACLRSAEAPGLIEDKVAACQEAIFRLEDLAELRDYDMELAQTYGRLGDLVDGLENLQQRRDALRRDLETAIGATTLEPGAALMLLRQTQALATAPLAVGDPMLREIGLRLGTWLHTALEKLAQALVAAGLLQYVEILHLAEQVPWGRPAAAASLLPLSILMEEAANRWGISNDPLKRAYGALLVELIVAGGTNLTARASELYAELCAEEPDPQRLAELQEWLSSRPDPAGAAARAFFQVAVVHATMQRVPTYSATAPLAQNGKASAAEARP